MVNRNAAASAPVSAGNRARKWDALSGREHPLACGRETADNQFDNKTTQLTQELIVISNSCDVNVTVTDTKAALNIQAALQAAFIILISISVASADQAEAISNDLLQTIKVKQESFSQIIVEDSKNVDVSKTDTQLLINIQLLLQLITLVAVQIGLL
ncbi:spore coat protein [Alteribacter natronophilus]|nr:spore coat protein [Alteribacter natronophilus]